MKGKRGGRGGAPAIEKTRGETCVLAYSGGLDTSVAVAWLRETYGFEVVTCTGDLGSVRDLPSVQKKAIASGARKAIVQDARDVFVEYFVWPGLQAGALYQERYPLATALGRPLLAKLLVDAARDEGAPTSRTVARARATTRCASISRSARSPRT